MTHTESRLKFPIGAKIKYMPEFSNVCEAARKDIGRQGTVVSHLNNQVQIYLPESEKNSKTWRTFWRCIVLLPQKNQQLEFSFMD